MAECGGMPVLARSIQALAGCDFVQEIVLVTRTEKIGVVGELAREYGRKKVSKIVQGGATRVLSSYAGVMSCSKKARLIAIHDGARPLVTEKLILEACWGAWRHLCAAPAVPVKDTIKYAENGAVQYTPDRSHLFAVQTPQVFRADLIRAALVRAAETPEVFTDDCSVVEAFGAVVHLTEGDERNLKITTPGDILLAEALLEGKL